MTSKLPYRLNEISQFYLDRLQHDGYGDQQHLRDLFPRDPHSDLIDRVLDAAADEFPVARSIADAHRIDRIAAYTTVLSGADKRAQRRVDEFEQHGIYPPALRSVARRRESRRARRERRELDDLNRELWSATRDRDTARMRQAIEAGADPDSKHPDDIDDESLDLIDYIIDRHVWSSGWLSEIQVCLDYCAIPTFEDESDGAETPIYELVRSRDHHALETVLDRSISTPGLKIEATRRGRHPDRFLQDFVLHAPVLFLNDPNDPQDLDRIDRESAATLRVLLERGADITPAFALYDEFARFGIEMPPNMKRVINEFRDNART